MNEKKNIQQMAEILTQQLSFPRKTIESFVRSLSDTIVEALMADGFVRVKGLGTFKIVEVESRESINVNNGERIVIPSFKKITFVPEDSANEVIQAATAGQTVIKEEEPAEEPTEEATAEPTKESTDAVASQLVEEPVEEEPAEEPIEEPVKEQPAEEPVGESVSEEPVKEQQAQEPVEEIPADEFSGIDLLISTPESVADMHEQLLEVQHKRDAVYDELTQARQQADECRERRTKAEDDLKEAEELRRQADERAQYALNAIKAVDVQLKEAEGAVQTCQTRAEEADAEVKRVEQMVQNVENNTQPVFTPARHVAEPVVEKDDKVVEEEQVEDKETEGKVHPKSKKRYRWILWLLLLLFVAGGCAFYYLCLRSAKDKVSQPTTEQPSQPATPAKPKPTPAQPAPTDSLAAVAVPSDSAKTSATDNPVETPATVAEPTKPEPNKPEAKPEPAKPESAKPERPTTYVLKRGESLTKVSRVIYGTPDSVGAIIRVNKFKDPNNVPAGATIKLP